MTSIAKRSEAWPKCADAVSETLVLDFTPDISAGVFTTLRVEDGQAVALDAHIERLTQSAENVYEQAIPAHLGNELVAAAANTRTPLQMRGALIPAEGGLRVSVTVSERPPVPSELTWHITTIPAWSCNHKWVSRPDIERGTALIVSEDELVLEADTAAVLALVDDVVVVPVSNRSLPSISRAAVLQCLDTLNVDVEWRPLYLDELLTAEAVFSVSSIRGLRPVKHIDHHEWPLADHPLWVKVDETLEEFGGWDIDAPTYRRYASAPKPA